MNKKSEHKRMGRPPSEFPEFLKKLRASESERLEFLALLPGDAREDFLQIMDALKNKKASAVAEARSDQVVT